MQKNYKYNTPKFSGVLIPTVVGKKESSTIKHDSKIPTIVGIFIRMRLHTMGVDYSKIPTIVGKRKIGKNQTTGVDYSKIPTIVGRIYIIN